MMSCQQSHSQQYQLHQRCNSSPRDTAACLRHSTSEWTTEDILKKRSSGDPFLCVKMLPILDINEALSKGDFSLLRTLVVSGADVNLQDKEGRTALINCCLHDGETWALGSARLLLTHGAKISLCDKVGRNALMYAVMYNRESLVTLFLSALDCELTHTDKWKHTVLWYAVLTGNSQITTMLKEIFRKYGLDTEDRSSILKTKDNSTTQEQNKSQQQSKTKVNKIHYTPPYKTISADIWEKRAKLHNATKGKLPQTTSKLHCGLKTQEKSHLNKESLASGSNSNQHNSQDADWRQDIQRLTATLEMQLSPSYCRKARILPPSVKRYPKICKSEMNRFSEDELRGKRRSRRLSVDVLDVLQSKKSTKGIFRRRCSVAIIPLIRFQSCKSSLSNEQSRQKMKSILP